MCLGRVLLQLTVKDSRQVDTAWSVPWEIIITVKVKDSRQVEIYICMFGEKRLGLSLL